MGTLGGRLGYVYRRVLNGFEAELTEYQAERLARHPLVKSVVQETYLYDQVSYTLPHCYEDFDTNTRTLPPLPGPGNPAPQQTLDCADPAPGGDCIDNWGVDRVDQYGLPRDEEFNYRQASGNVKVFVVDRGVARDNREFDDASGTSRVAPGIDTACSSFPDNCNPGDVPCEALVVEKAMALTSLRFWEEGLSGWLGMSRSFRSRRSARATPKRTSSGHSIGSCLNTQYQHQPPW